MLFEWLERAYVERDMAITWLKIDTDFRSLRDEPRYTRLLRKMNLRTSVIVDVSAKFAQRARKLLEHQLWRPPRFAVLLAYPIHLVDEVRQRIVRHARPFPVPQKPFDPSEALSKPDLSYWLWPCCADPVPSA